MDVVTLKARPLHRKPDLDSFPNVRPQREDLPGASPGEKVDYHSQLNTPFFPPDNIMLT